MKKLRLNKEKIAQLSDQEASSIQGGGTANSTNAGFTCCWCSSETGSEEPRCDSYQCSTSETTRQQLCPVNGQ
ncbi:class I lanthipeptide [Flavobacterium sp. KS-LB2]|uniref:class I lanthipeptide n=1 Tax=Flavobacterium sp. KS-LB2 TaxID=3120525 RepID=UPI0030CDA4E8